MFQMNYSFMQVVCTRGKIEWICMNESKIQKASEEE